MEKKFMSSKWPILAAIQIVSFILPSGTWAKQDLTEEELLKRFEHEPTVQKVQDAAIRYYKVHPERIGMLLRNAQLKAIIPTVSGQFANDVTSSMRIMQDGFYINSLPYKEDETVNGDKLGFKIQASWILDRLLFNAEVLDVQSLIGILDGVVREVTTVYYIRRRLQIDMVLRPPPDLATRISQRIRIDELTGLLDAMTGGVMTKALRKSELAKR
ncbi:MAG: hypothetical protein V1754_09495 [Pseudomonadota bacterium]